MKLGFSAVLLIMSVSAFGFDRGQQGLGLMLGQPSGIRYSYFSDPYRALYADLSYEFEAVNLLQGGYVFYFYDASNNNPFSFYVTPGLTAGLRNRSDEAKRTVLGPRVATGFECFIAESNWAARVEVGSYTNLIGQVSIEFQGFVGLTYYFGGEPSEPRNPEKLYKIESSDDEDLSGLE